CQALTFTGAVSEVEIRVTGTFTGTLKFEDSGGTLINCLVTTTGSNITSTTSPVNCSLNTQGKTGMQVIANSFTSGTATVSLLPLHGPFYLYSAVSTQTISATGSANAAVLAVPSGTTQIGVLFPTPAASSTFVFEGHSGGSWSSLTAVVAGTSPPSQVTETGTSDTDTNCTTGPLNPCGFTFPTTGLDQIRIYATALGASEAVTFQTNAGSTRP